MAGGEVLEAIRQGGTRLGPALDALVRDVDGQLTAAERLGLSRMLDAWPGSAEGTPARPEALAEGLAALLAQARAARGVDAFEALKAATKSGAFGLLCGIVAALLLEVMIHGRAWAGPPAIAWAVAGTPTVLLAGFGYHQARRPMRLTRALFHAMVALPVGGFAGALLLIVLPLWLGELLPAETMDGLSPALMVSGLFVASLAGGAAAAAWAMRRAWRRWDQVGR